MKLTVAYLAIGEAGDSTVILFDGPGRPSCIVIDGGNTKKGGNVLSEYLRRKGVVEIDLMVGTHLDMDHINGLKEFVKEEVKAKKAKRPFISVRRYWGPQPREVKATYRPTGGGMGASSYSPAQQIIVESVNQHEDLLAALQSLVPEVEISFPSREKPPRRVFSHVNLEVLGPAKQISSRKLEKEALSLGASLREGGTLHDGDDLSVLAGEVSSQVESLAAGLERQINNQSIVFRLTAAKGKPKPCGAWRFLFTGDAGQEAWDDMTGDPMVKRRLAAAVLKIPHHGSARLGITASGVKAVKPKVAVNMVGDTHGIPDAETLELIAGSGAKILCTQRNDSTEDPSACRNVPASECPAKNDPQHIEITVDTETGQADVPLPRACRHAW